jgi:ATP-binding cassette subfamily F protein 3
MILSLNNVQKAFGTDVILENVSLTAEANDKIGIVGVNGAGKSTLFKTITGELSLDGGSVTIPNDATLGYFSQNLEVDSSKTIYEELLTVFEPIMALEEELRQTEHKMGPASGEELERLMEHYNTTSHLLEEKGGYEYQSRLRGVIKGLGFTSDEAYQHINELSGGQKTRVALGKLLLSSPDILLLDEPTNHLDIASLQWLEDFIRAYKSCVIIISHDRYFLDKTVAKILEIENRKSHLYLGNYSDYAVKKAVDREIELKHYENNRREIKRQEEVIRKLKSYNREKSIKRAESREKALEKMERLDTPESLPNKMRLEITPLHESGNDVLTVTELSKGFDGKELFKNISFDIKRGDKVALIGPNGIGKTTLFRIILGRLEADSGTHKLGTGVVVGYYDQEHATLNPDKTIFDEISDTYPDLKITTIRNVLAAFVFTGDDVFKKISTLSGGEKGRVSLAKIMLSNANFLVLDEPTNHLDLNSKEILENALSSYKGTVLYISHDRYFINATAERIVELTPNGANTYLGNYDFYTEKQSQRLTELKDNPAESIADTESKQDWQKQKQEQAAKRKIENLVKKLEDDIAVLEAKIDELNSQLELPEVFTDAGRAKAVFEEKQKAEDELAILYNDWEENSAKL